MNLVAIFWHIRYMHDLVYGCVGIYFGDRCIGQCYVKMNMVRIRLVSVSQSIIIL